MGCVLPRNLAELLGSCKEWAWSTLWGEKVKLSTLATCPLKYLIIDWGFEVDKQFLLHAISLFLSKTTIE
jgi:hypothetical protein